MKHVSILGAGAWGTALALAAFRAGSKVTIWSISYEEVETINQRHENVYRLPGIPLDPSLQATLDHKEAGKADVIILAPPAQFTRETCIAFKKAIPHQTPLIIASKGVEEDTAHLMSDIVREVFPKNPLLVLSGPSFAAEVAENLPTSVALAGEDFTLAQTLAKALSSHSFQLVPSDDLIGVQVGGACKNIVAIACGIVEGRELGDNARAATLTKGLDEIAALGCAMGGKAETFLGLAGIGDLTLTALSPQSRNTSFGLALGRGTSVSELMKSQQALTEGVHTAAAVTLLARKHKVRMPLVEAMNTLLHTGGSIDSFLENLFNQKEESYGLLAHQN